MKTKKDYEPLSAEFRADNVPDPKPGWLLTGIVFGTIIAFIAAGLIASVVDFMAKWRIAFGEFKGL